MHALGPRRISIPETGRTWFDVLKGPLPDSVSRRVEEETGWENGQHASIDDSQALIEDLRTGDRVIFLESEARIRMITLNVIVDRVKVSSKRFRHFVEYKQLGRRRKLTNSLETQLESAKILERRGYRLNNRQARIAHQVVGVPEFGRK